MPARRRQSSEGSLRGFAPVEGRNARVLILGSFPSEASLAAGEYYGHPQNRFWRTMAAVAGFAPGAPYALRTAALRGQGIALWDVLGSCARRGSLDSAILAGSEVPNDIGAVIARHPDLRRILLNGRKAADLFSRLVVPQEFWGGTGLSIRVMPSTSPANAAVRLRELQAQWRAAILD